MSLTISLSQLYINSSLERTRGSIDVVKRKKKEGFSKTLHKKRPGYSCFGFEIPLIHRLFNFKTFETHQKFPSQKVAAFFLYPPFPPPYSPKKKLRYEHGPGNAVKPFSDVVPWQNSKFQRDFEVITVNSFFWKGSGRTTPTGMRNSKWGFVSSIESINREWLMLEISFFYFWLVVSTHLKNMLVKLDHLPKVRGENKKYLKAPPRFHSFMCIPFILFGQFHSSMKAMNKKYGMVRGNFPSLF